MAKTKGLPSATSPPYRVKTVAASELVVGDYIRNRSAERPGEYWPRITEVEEVGEWITLAAGNYHTSMHADEKVQACASRFEGK